MKHVLFLFILNAVMMTSVEARRKRSDEDVSTKCHENVFLYNNKLYSQLGDLPITKPYEETMPMQTKLNTPANWKVVETTDSVMPIVGRFPWSKLKMMVADGRAFSTSEWQNPGYANDFFQVDIPLFSPNADVGVLLEHKECPVGYFLAIPCHQSETHCHPIPQQYKITECKQNIVMFEGNLYSTLDDTSPTKDSLLECNESDTEDIAANWIVAEDTGFNIHPLAERFMWNSIQLVTSNGNSYWTASGEDFLRAGMFAEKDQLKRIWKTDSSAFTTSNCQQQILLQHKPCPPGTMISNVCEDFTHCIKTLPAPPEKFNDIYILPNFASHDEELLYFESNESSTFDNFSFVTIAVGVFLCIFTLQMAILIYKRRKIAEEEKNQVDPIPKYEPCIVEMAPVRQENVYSPENADDQKESKA